MKLKSYLNEETKKSFSKDDAKSIGDKLKVDWDKIDIKEFTMGLNVELEHGTKNPDTNITDNNPVETAKIALAHLGEILNYYTLLKDMEDKAKGK